MVNIQTNQNVEKKNYPAKKTHFWWEAKNQALQEMESKHFDTLKNDLPTHSSFHERRFFTRFLGSIWNLKQENCIQESTIIVANYSAYLL